MHTPSEARAARGPTARHPRARSHRTLRLLTLICGSGLLLAFSARPAQARASVEAGGGFLVPFDSDHRDVYGAAGQLSLGASAALDDGHTWLFVESGLIRSSGDEFPNDGTFEASDSEYRLYPIALGVRTNVLRTGDESRVAFFLGLAGQTLFTSWEDPNGESFSTPTLGLLMEIRPAYKVGERVSLWASQRLSLVGATDYDRRISRLDYSGSALQFGVSLLVN